MGGRRRRFWASMAAIGLMLIGGRLVEADEPDGEKAAGIKTAVVEFRGSHGPIKGYLARPEGDGPFRAIVVVHEWWGLSDWIKQNADRFARLGYVALAVDLYEGKATDDPGTAHELMRALDDREALADLKGGIAYLRSLPIVAKERKLGVIGWCMGGKFARLLGQESDQIGPTVICYGSVATEDEQVSRLKGKPVLGIFGEDDRGIPPEKVKQFGQALERLGGRAEIHIYPAAGHGFMRPGGDQHEPDAARQAWGEIESFFADHLKDE